MVEKWFELSAWSSTMGAIAIMFLIILGRYLVVAGLFFWSFWLRGSQRGIKLQDLRLDYRKVRFEIRWSVLSSIIYAVPGALILSEWQAGRNAIYSVGDQYGWWYLPFSLLVYMFLQDTYFYWTHRLLHVQPFYKWWHKVHHESTDPTPWASFSFHFGESVISAPLVLLLSYWIPIHIGVFSILLVVMTLCAVVNHNGYEFLPERFLHSRFGKAWITATHHNLHHRFYNCNYGLFFRFWDRLMATDVMYNPYREVFTARDFRDANKYRKINAAR